MRNCLSKILFSVFLIFQIFILVSCGGGSSSSNGGSNTGPSNTTPTDNVPTLTKSSPANGVIDVSTNPQIQLNFSESVTNVNTTTVVLHESSPTGTVIQTTDLVANPSKDMYTFNAKSPLNPLTVYYVVLSNGIKSSATGASLVATNFHFTTGNSTAPTVSMIYPTPESTNVSTSVSIQLSFSVPVTNVDTTTVTLHESSPSGAIVATTSINNSGDDQNYSFSPLQALNSNTTYYVVFTNQIVSISDNEPLSPTSFYFTTGSVINPTVIMLSPKDNSEINDLSPTIRIRFSESVTDISKGVSLHESSPNGTEVPLGPITSLPDNIYSFKAKGPLSIYTTYYLNIGNSVVSVNSGESVIPVSFNFTVTAPTFAYIADNQGVTVCHVTETKFDPCQVTLTNSNVYRVAINSTHTLAYLAEKDLNEISLCQINRTDGALYNCEVDTNTFNKPTSIAFASDDSYLLVTNSGNNTVSRCSILTEATSNQPVGGLTNCTSTSKQFDQPNAIVTDSINKNAFIVNTGNHSISQCELDESGLINNCVEEANNLVSPMGAVMSADSLNLYTTSNNSIGACAIDYTGGVVTCRGASTESFTTLSDIAIDGNDLYVADSGNGAISKCPKDQDGNFNACRYISLDHFLVTGIEILNK